MLAFHVRCLFRQPPVREAVCWPAGLHPSPWGEPGCRTGAGKAPGGRECEVASVPHWSLVGEQRPHPERLCSPVSLQALRAQYEAAMRTPQEAMDDLQPGGWEPLRGGQLQVGHRSYTLVPAEMLWGHGLGVRTEDQAVRSSVRPGRLGNTEILGLRFASLPAVLV